MPYKKRIHPVNQGDLPMVKSKKDGTPLRALPGSNSKAPLYEGSEKNSAKATPVSSAGKPVCRYMKMSAPAFTGKNFWTDMMRRMFRAGSVATDALLKSLIGMEINPAYAMEKLVQPVPQIEVRQKGKKISAGLHLSAHADFPKVKFDSYYYELYLLWIDNTCHQFEGASVETEWISKNDDLPYFEMEFKRPPWGHYGVFILKIRAGLKMKAVESFTATGMRIVAVV